MVRDATNHYSPSDARNHGSIGDAPTVKSAKDARQGGRPKTMLLVLIASLILAAIVAVFLAGAFEF